MDSVLEFCIKNGIVTQRQTITSLISLQPQLKIPMPGILPTDIGRIIGLSIYADTIDPANNTLITTAQAQRLYLNLKDAQTEFFEPVRLDDLLFNFAGVPVPSGEKYMPVNIGRFDLSTSVYINPTLIVSRAAPAKPFSIMLNLVYLNVKDYNNLIAKDIVLQSGLSQSDLSRK